VAGGAGLILVPAFFIAGKMAFIIGIPLVLASISGNYLGSHLTLKSGDKIIKPLNESSSDTIHISEINKVISEADVEGLDTFFLEVLVKPGVRVMQAKEEVVEDFLE
jgi:hypothetical protein